MVRRLLCWNLPQCSKGISIQEWELLDVVLYQNVCSPFRGHAVKCTYKSLTAYISNSERVNQQQNRVTDNKRAVDRRDVELEKEQEQNKVMVDS